MKKKDMTLSENDFRKVIDIALRAGEAVCAIYNSGDDFSVERKGDDSPLTVADKRSHEVIFNGLTELFPDIPILSEEGKAIPFEVRKQWQTYWLVDPLDGTKEFLSRNGEFTINIALMEESEPVAGVVYAPAIDRLYYAGVTNGAFKRESDGQPVAIHVEHASEGSMVAAQSRSHASPEEVEFLKRLNVVDTIRVGSSLKFCMIAEGKAHIYPRFGPMMEWDTAAGHAVVAKAGGIVRSWKGSRVEYNTESLRHNGMIVSSQPLSV
jgi:3'(2'), 5'-bisphosphate nucleotidase